MKKLLLSLMFLTISTCLKAQDFGAVGTKWYYTGNGGGGIPPNTEYWYLESVSDTVIKGKITHKIKSEYYKRDGKISKDAPLYLYQHLDTVFMYYAKKEKFLTLFIFNAKQGDTITLDVPWPEEYQQLTDDTTYRVVINNVVTRVVDGVPLKIYGAKRLDDFELYNFMDRIGGLHLFFPEYYSSIPETDGPIRCFKDNQMDTSFQNGPCDYVWYTSLKHINQEFKTNLSPNPGNGLFKLETPYLESQDLRIIDTNGRIVYNAKVESSCEIDLSQLENGIYQLVLVCGHSVETVCFVISR